MSANKTELFFHPDRYLLLTFDESPRNVKIGWKDNMMTFNNELKQLKAVSLTTMGGTRLVLLGPWLQAQSPHAWKRRLIDQNQSLLRLFSESS